MRGLGICRGQGPAKGGGRDLRGLPRDDDLVTLAGQVPGSRDPCNIMLIVDPVCIAWNETPRICMKSIFGTEPISLLNPTSTVMRKLQRVGTEPRNQDAEATERHGTAASDASSFWHLASPVPPLFASTQSVSCMPEALPCHFEAHSTQLPVHRALLCCLCLASRRANCVSAGQT